MPPRFQRFLGTEGILGKVRCHKGEGAHHGLRTGWVYYFYFIFTSYYINLADKQNKQNSKKEEERKKEKETETERAENIIFKGLRTKVRPEQS